MIYMGMNLSGKNMSYMDMNTSRKGILLTKTLFKSKFAELLNFIKYLTMY